MGKAQEMSDFSHDPGPDQAMTKQPNIILIVADDMGYGDCSCFGSESIQTPHKECHRFCWETLDATALAGRSVSVDRNLCPVSQNSSLSANGTPCFV